MVRNRISFYGEELLPPGPNPKLEERPLLAICDCLFNIFAATLNIGGRSSIRKLRMRHAVVQGTSYQGALPNSSTLPHKPARFCKMFTELKMCILVFSTVFPEIFIFLIGTEPDIIINVRKCSCKEPIILFVFW